MIKILIQTVLLQLILVLGLCEYELNHRVLDSCSSYTSCSACSSNSACIFLKNFCVSASTSTVSTDAYSPSTEGAYCSSSTSSGIIYLGSTDETYSLFQFAGASLSAHPTCRWIFSNSGLKTLKLTIQRSPSNYEDIYLQYNIDSQTYFLSTKDLTSCSSSTSSITLSNASSIIIKVKRLSSMSNYTIILSSQNNNSESNSEGPGLAVTIVVTSALFFSIILIIIFIIVCVLYTKQRDQQKQDLPSRINKAQYIEQTLSNMTACAFEKCSPKYKQDSCVICLENFKADSQICVTNECDHIFHSECLRNWYDSIKASKKLTCPHCCTENTPNSHPQESCELESVESCHIKMAYQHLMTEHGDNMIESSHLNASNHN